ncbi:MAG TPA: glycoside hydrolase family 65 [Verrucomicrobiae bacterium]
MTRVTRREFLRSSGVAALSLVSPSVVAAAALRDGARREGRIDRHALVGRHNPIITRFDPFAALSLGNGEAAFTADITGLQTFASECEKQFPLCTASHWGWHSAPAAQGLRREDFRYQDFDTDGRPVGYATNSKGQEGLFNWLRQNPHRLHLGRLAFEMKFPGGTAATPEDLKDTRQMLDLWTGLLESRFSFLDKPVLVRTCFHPDLDLLAVSVESPLLRMGKLKVLLTFPYGSPEVGMADWTKPDQHITQVTRTAANHANFTRKLDDTEYSVSLAWSKGATLEQRASHEFVLVPGSTGSLEFRCLFSPRPFIAELPGVRQAASASATHWRRFWTEGGAVDLGDSTAPEAAELERRLVLSLYQTAIHCAGSLPSAETGLLCNSWYGKFHLEMHWWHSAHFAAWGRFHLFEGSLGIYQRILPLARETARRQGYRGVRWPKMIGPDGLESPSAVGPLLIWQQPHPIYYAELCYRARPTRETCDRWREIVFETAEFLASFPVWDPACSQSVLGPPLKTVSENTDALTARNPTFELAYWRFGLRTAQLWRERLGLAREARWEKVLESLAPLPAHEGCYLMQEGLTDTYTKWNWEHPALVGALGMLPGDGVDLVTMRRTVRRVMDTWHWERSWGWDFPLTAMAAARAGEPELAVRALLMNEPKNRYLQNGHNYQRPGLSAYLPGNGGLLAAIAMMAKGWNGGPTASAPSFPADGQWSVRAEGLKTWL